jgi:hypothetical protein
LSVSQTANFIDKVYVATVNVASELTSGRTTRGAEIRRSLRVWKACMHVGVVAVRCGIDSFNKHVNGADRSLN